MDGMRPLGAGAVLVIAIGLGAILATLVTNAGQFADAGVETAALVTTIVFVVSILAFVGIGRPWQSWERTAYW